MGRPEVATGHEQLTKLAREQRTLREVVSTYEQFRRAQQEAESAHEMLKHEKDQEMQEYLHTEERRAAERAGELEEKLKVRLLPKDPNDDRDVIVEIQGAEAGEQTGLVVSMQDEKSQLQNREKALRVLRTRLYDLKLAEQQEKIGAQRRTMVGTGGRSEKIRTYNFKENRVTDHRIKLTLHKLDQVMAGDLDELVSALIAADRAAQLGGSAA